MKKILIFGLILTGLTLLNFKFVHAAGNLPMGGRIDMVEAWEIQTLIDSGFICVSGGVTFDMVPSGKSPRGPYLAPFSLKRREPRSGAWILGLYYPGIVASCTNVESDATVEVEGLILKIYGTSKI